MNIAALDPCVLNEVARLNIRYLQAARHNQDVRGPLRERLGERQWSSFLAADEQALAELAAMPILLFDLTGIALNIRPDTPQEDLRAIQGNNDLLLLALGFVHQLNLSSRFCVRVITGADALWCERLSNTPMADLADFVVVGDSMLQPTLGSVPGYWQTLMRAVVNRHDDEIRAIKALGIQHLMQRLASKAPIKLAAARRRSMAARLAP